MRRQLAGTTVSPRAGRASRASSVAEDSQEGSGSEKGPSGQSAESAYPGPRGEKLVGGEATAPVCFPRPSGAARAGSQGHLSYQFIQHP